MSDSDGGRIYILDSQQPNSFINDRNQRSDILLTVSQFVNRCFF